MKRNKCRKITRVCLYLLLIVGEPGIAQTTYDGALLVEGMSLAVDKIVFSVGGNIYQVPRIGGVAEPIVHSTNDDRYPIVSEDGTLVAFSRLNTGNGDVYLVNLQDGVEKQITYHPSRDWPNDFTRLTEAEGMTRTLLFSSTRENLMAPRLYEIDLSEHWPRAVDLPFAMSGSYSHDNSEIYYSPKGNGALPPRNYYRGGLMSQVFSMALPAGEPTQLTGSDFNAYNPIATERGVVFLGDQNAVLNVYCYQFDDGQVKALTNYDQVSVTALAADDFGVVYEHDGSLYSLDWDSGNRRKISVLLPLDNELMQPQVVNALPLLEHVSSRDNNRIFLTARGEIFFFDVSDQRAGNLSKTPAVREQGAKVSATGRSLAYFDDESGNYQLVISDLDSGQKRSHVIEPAPGFYADLEWSANDRYLSFSDGRLALWVFDNENQSFSRIASSTHAAQIEFHTSWSPGSRYLAYNLRNPRGVSQIYLYDTENQTSRPLTGSYIYSDFPMFDLNGDYLYFTESPNQQLNDLVGFTVLSALENGPGITSRLSVVSLSESAPAPYLRVTGRPNPAISRTLASEDVEIDWTDIEGRIIQLPVDLRGVGYLGSLVPGELLLVNRDWPTNPVLGALPRYSLHHMQLFNPARAEKLTENLRASSVDFSTGNNSRQVLVRFDNEFKLYRRERGNWVSELLTISGLPMTVDYQAEWAHIYQESWRYIEEQFYDPGFHGYDLAALEQSYSKFLPGIVSRQGLTSLLNRIKSQLSISHAVVGVGDTGLEPYKTVNAGLLGADFIVEDGRYKIDEVLHADRSATTEELAFSPLHLSDQVEVGMFLLAINGRQLTAEENLYRALRGAAGSVVRLRFSDDVAGTNSFDIEVRTLKSEQALRALSRNSRSRLLAQKLDSAVTYLSLASFRPAHIEKFLADLLSADHTKPMVVDIRFNGGGVTGDWLIDFLNREPLYGYLFRRGQPLTVPLNTVANSKVLLVNSWNASAAETFTFMFQQGKLGTVVGTRTLGALNGGFGKTYQSVDGAVLGYPARATFDLVKDFLPENIGMTPDREVAFGVQAWREGRDTQLEAALSVAARLDRSDRASARHISLPIHPE